MQAASTICSLTTSQSIKQKLYTLTLSLPRSLSFLPTETCLQQVVSGLIRRACRFSLSVQNKETRRDFEDYLDCQWADYSTECKPVNPKTRPCVDGRDSRGLRWRLVNDKPVAVNLLANDLFFYLETKKFKQLQMAGWHQKGCSERTWCFNTKPMSPFLLRGNGRQTLGDPLL